MNGPVRPTNARIVHANGDVVPLELIYQGIKGGLHRWSGAAIFDPRTDELLVDVMPPRTAISLPFAKPPHKEDR